jgi:hypothetical protein
MPRIANPPKSCRDSVLLFLAELLKPRIAAQRTPKRIEPDLAVGYACGDFGKTFQLLKTNHAAESATGCFLERATTGRKRRNLLDGGGAFLLGLSGGDHATQVPQFLVHLRGVQDRAVHFFT